MIRWIKMLLHTHNWVVHIYSAGCYDEEIWRECTVCKKQQTVENYTGISPLTGTMKYRKEVK